jgi:hypothetical protein
MLAPDGTSGEIPVARIGDALKAGFKQAVAMVAPTGESGWIPSDQVEAAKAKGFDDSPQTLIQAQQKLFAAGNKNAAPVYNYLVHSGHAKVNAQGGLEPMDQMGPQPGWGEQALSLIKHPLNSLEEGAQPVSRPRDASVGEMATADANNIVAGVTNVVRHPVQTSESVLAPVADLVTGPFESMAGDPNAFSHIKELAAGVADLLQHPSPEKATYALGQAIATAGLMKGVGIGAEAGARLVPEGTVPAVGHAVRSLLAGDVNEPIPGTDVTPAARYASMKDMGIQPNAAEATNSTPLKMAEWMNEDSLTSAQTYAKARGKNLEALNDYTNNVLDKMSPKGAEEGGAAVQQGLRNAQVGLQNDAAEGFSKLDRAVGTRRMSGGTLQETAKNIYDANADYYKAHPELVPGNAWKIVKDLAGADSDFQSRPMSFGEVHQLRSDLLELVRSNPDIVTNQAGGWLKQLAQAADQTITSGATGLSPAGTQVFRDANEAWANMKGTYDNPSHPFYNAVRTPTPSNLVKGIGQTPEMTKALTDALGPDGMGPIQRGVAENLLRTTKEGGYNFKTFQGQWNKLKPAYRDALFTPEQQQQLADIGNAGTVLHDDINPSGTAHLGQKMGEMGEAGSAIGAAALAHPLPLAGTVAYHAAQYALGKLMNAPTFVDWLMRERVTPALTAAQASGGASTGRLIPAAVASGAMGSRTGPDGQPNFYSDEYLRSKAAFDAARNAAQ